MTTTSLAAAATMTPLTLSLTAVRAQFEQQTPLAVGDALAIIHAAQDRMGDEPNLVIVERPTTYIFGDIHGQFFDLLQLLERIGLEDLQARNIQLVFLGDYVDRGVFSCEALLFLLLLKVTFPTHVLLLRGNHECETISSFYGFRNECRVKYGLSVYYHFVSCFQAMPLAALVRTARGDLFCVHGGISPEIHSLEDLTAIDRHREIPVSGPLCDLLWSDPTPEDGEHGSTDLAAEEPSWVANDVRGCSYYFNAAALFQFLEANKLLAVIRAHEYEEMGFMYHFTGDTFERLDHREDKCIAPLITVFSAANYCDTNGNLAGYLVIHSDPFQLEAKQVPSCGHPVPALLAIERSADIWRQFRRILPFLPASKDFFEEILMLSGLERPDDSPTHPSTNSRLSESSAPDSGSTREEDRRRRQTNEMHPSAIRKVLDEEASKWMQTEDDGCFEVYSGDSGQEAQSCNQTTRHLSKCLSSDELEMMKLCFSLMDTDGSMTLNAAEVSQFVFNILGERISPQMAQTYLSALDYDKNGVVDFGDILSWAAIMKANYERQDDSFGNFLMIKASSILNCVDPYRAFLWMTVGYIFRDIVYFRRQPPKSRSLRVLRFVALTLYGLDVMRIFVAWGLSKWIWKLLRRSRRFLKGSTPRA